MTDEIKNLKITQEELLRVLKDPVRRKVCNDLAREVCILHERSVEVHKKRDPLTNIECLLVALFVNAHMHLHVANSMTECGHDECTRNEGHLLLAAGLNITHAMIDAAQPEENNAVAH